MYTRKYKPDYCGGNNSCFRNSERINCPEKIKRKVVFEDEIVRREIEKDEKYKEVKIPIHFDSFPHHGIIKEHSEHPPAWQHFRPFEKKKDSDFRRDFRKKKYFASDEEQEWSHFRDPVHAAILEAANNVYSHNRNLPGYGLEREPHPFYRTTSMSYGYYPLTEGDHTMNLLSRTPRKCHLNGHMADTLFRNRSLNVSHN